MKYKIIDPQNLKYEEAINKINKINILLEDNKIPLDEAIKYYEEGRELIHFCEKKLKTVENKLNEINIINDDKITKETIK